jgi:hypothetical protein
LCASAGRDGGQGCIVTSCLKASTPVYNHHTWKGCRHPHIEPEQQESEKSAERRRKQLAAECWRMNTGVESVADLPSTWVAQDGTACVCSRKQRRNETSQGTWDAWCRAKVHGKLTSKLTGASTELPSRIIQSMGEAMEEAMLYRRYRHRDCRPPKNFTRHPSIRMHNGTGKQAQGLWRGDAWWRDMTDHRASTPLRNRDGKF